MIKSNIYCQCCGMVMQCIVDLDKDLPIVCEIGCADGQGVARYAGFCQKVYCIDPMVSNRPDIVSFEFKELDECSQKVDSFYDNVSHVVSNVQLIKGCSAWSETLDEFKKCLGDDLIDILVIDGCHHPFEAVWKDFELYEPFVKNGGFVIFDDLYEECVLQAYEKAKKPPYNMIEHDRKGWNKPNFLQDVGSLKKQ